jgi:hypothetical protein
MGEDDFLQRVKYIPYNISSSDNYTIYRFTSTNLGKALGGQVYDSKYYFKKNKLVIFQFGMVFL